MRLLNSLILLTAMAVGSALYAQDPAPPPASGDNQKVSVTGCLTKATESAGYMITDQKTGEKVPFSGPAQLDKYVNQTVRLTGTVGQDKVFKPESINQVSATCEKSE